MKRNEKPQLISKPKPKNAPKKIKKVKLPRRERALKDRIAHAKLLTDRLASLYPNAKCALNHRNAFELLVATVLSAQTTDKRVNSVTPALFSAYPNPQAMAEADFTELTKILQPLGFYRAKARSIQALSVTLLEDFEGEVPNTLEELTTLRGVGRKTANVVLGNIFDTPGITVDTHVGRIARRWAWTRETDPVKAEMELNKLLPPKIWTVTCHRIIEHGRKICHSRNPECGMCAMADLCPSYEIFMHS